MEIPPLAPQYEWSSLTGLRQLSQGLMASTQRYCWGGQNERLQVLFVCVKPLVFFFFFFNQRTVLCAAVCCRWVNIQWLEGDFSA